MFVSLIKGEDHSLGIYPCIILETKAFTSTLCSFLKCPSSQGLVSLKKGASSESYFPMEAPSEPGYSNSPMVQTEQLFRGYKVQGNHQK